MDRHQKNQCHPKPTRLTSPGICGVATPGARWVKNGHSSCAMILYKLMFSFNLTNIFWLSLSHPSHPSHPSHLSHLSHLSRLIFHYFIIISNTENTPTLCRQHQRAQAWDLERSSELHDWTSQQTSTSNRIIIVWLYDTSFSKTCRSSMLFCTSLPSSTPLGCSNCRLMMS